MERPLYHSTIRAGYIYQTDETFWFLYRDSNGLLQIDRWSMNSIRNGSMRFYKYYQSPSENVRYSYSTIHNDSTHIVYEVWTPLAGSLDHLNFTVTPNEIVRYFIVTMNPSITDAHYRYTNSIDTTPLSPLSLPDGVSLLGSETTSLLYPPPPLLIPLSEFPLDSVDFDLLENSNRESSENQVTTEEDDVITHIDINDTNETGMNEEITPEVSTTLVNMLASILMKRKDLLIQPPNKRVCNIVIEDAIKQNTLCPITLNPITYESAKCVAPCYHVFEKEAIETWLSKSSACPQCRETCVL